MKSRWSNQDAEAMTKAYGAQGYNADIAIRVYTTRLLGSDPQLVLHGGGNTSVKTTLADALGSIHEVLCVKGSGWDMGRIEPAGLPAVELKPLAALADLASISDETLVASQRRMLIDPYAPNPSIEAVLHAIVPHKHVDHTHADAIIALSNQPNGEDIVRDVFPDTTIIPYVMPGFVLSKACRAALLREPNSKHMILMNHGIFTYSDDPREAYEQMIAMVDAAENRLAKGKARPFKGVTLPEIMPPLHHIVPVLRGALALAGKVEGNPHRWVLDHRSSEQILHFVNGEKIADYAMRGNAAPDHSIRVKRFGAVMPVPSESAQYAFAVKSALDDYANQYAAYFDRNNARHSGGLTMLDAVPRILYEQLAYS